jgi:acyl carrier protein
MNSNEIRNKVGDIAREVFDDEGLEVTDTLSRDDLESWDSLGHIRLIAAVEEVFKMSFTIDEIEGVNSIGQIVQVITERA